MKTLAILPLAFLITPADDLRLAPEEGARLTKTFASRTVLEGGDLEVTMDGMEIPAQFLPQLELTMESRSEMVFTDRYLGVANGRVTGLVRTFEDLEDVHEGTESMEGQGMEPTESESSTSGSSDLEGETVRFTWDAEEEEYDVEFERGEDGDDGLLEGLVAPLDLAAFLPGEDDEDSWTVPAEVLGQLLAPGGDLHFTYTGDDPDRYGGQDARTSFEGELTVTLRGAHTRGGLELMELEIEGEVSVSVETETDLDDIPVVDGMGLQTFTQVLSLEGALHWNTTANHLHSLELEGAVDATIEIEKDAESAGPSFSSTIHLEGEASYRVGFETAD